MDVNKGLGLWEDFDEGLGLWEDFAWKNKPLCGYMVMTEEKTFSRFKCYAVKDGRDIFYACKRVEDIMGGAPHVDST